MNGARCASGYPVRTALELFKKLQIYFLNVDADASYARVWIGVTIERARLDAICKRTASRVV
jgi:hypothetical protein